MPSRICERTKRNYKQKRYQKGLILRRVTHRVTDTHWWKLCPTCKKWFEINLEPPGTKIRSNLPVYCSQKCVNDNNNISLKEQIKNSEKEDIESIVSLYVEDCA